MERQSKKEKKLMDVDNNVVTVGGGRWRELVKGIQGKNGDGLET